MFLHLYTQTCAHLNSNAKESEKKCIGIERNVLFNKYLKEIKHIQIFTYFDSVASVKIFLMNGVRVWKSSSVFVWWISWNKNLMNTSPVQKKNCWKLLDVKIIHLHSVIWYTRNMKQYNENNTMDKMSTWIEQKKSITHWRHLWHVLCAMLFNLHTVIFCTIQAKTV